MNINKNIAISENGFVFNPSTGDSFSLNPIGTDIIKLLKEEKSVSEIVSELCKKYEVEKYNLENDINDFVFILEQYQLIENEGKN